MKPVDRLDDLLTKLEVAIIEECETGPMKQQALRKLDELKALARGALGDERDQIRALRVRDR